MLIKTLCITRNKPSIDSYVTAQASVLFKNKNYKMSLKNAMELTRYLKTVLKSFDKTIQKVKINSAGNGKVQAELKVEEEHSNPLGGLHGGFSATLVDCISTYALLTKMENPSVSVDIHMKYLKGAVIGDVILINAEVVRTGKTLAFLDVDIVNKTTGEILVKGSHTKYIINSR